MAALLWQIIWATVLPDQTSRNVTVTSRSPLLLYVHFDVRVETFQRPERQASSCIALRMLPDSSKDLIATIALILYCVWYGGAVCPVGVEIP